MKGKEFAELLRSIENRTFVGDKLTVRGRYDYCLEGQEDDRLNDEQIILLAKALRKNPSITKLELDGNNIEDAGAIALAGISSLEELQLYGNNITPVGAEALGKSTLKILSLEANTMGITLKTKEEYDNIVKMMKAFINNKTIVNLNFAVCGSIPDEIMAQLIGSNTTIKELVTSRDLSDQAFEFIKNNKTLETITLSSFFDKFITDKAVEYIIQNNSLKTLHIDSSRITDRGAEILSQHPTLKSLLLKNSNITFEGAKHFIYSALDMLELINGKPNGISWKEYQEIEYLFYEARKTESELPEKDGIEDEEMDCTEIEEETDKVVKEVTKKSDDTRYCEEDTTIVSTSGFTCDSNVLKVIGGYDELADGFYC